MKRVVIVFTLLCAFLAVAGCSRGPEKIVSVDGSRVVTFEVNGSVIVYTPRVATPSDATEKLVVRDRATGAETVLETDFAGSYSLSGRRLAYFNRMLTDKDKDFVGPVVLFDADSGQKTEILSAAVRGLALDGKNLLVEKTIRKDMSTGSDVFLFDLDSRAEKRLSSGGEDATAYNETAAISGNTAVWLENKWRDKTYAVKVYDLAAGTSVDIPLSSRVTTLAVSHPYVLYGFTDEAKTNQLHLYDVTSRSDTLVPTSSRIIGQPVMGDGLVAWTEYVTKERFNPIPGQPLMDEKDVRDVFTMGIASSSKKTIATDLFAIGARLAVSEGRVYMTLYRNPPPPGASNLSVSVDLVRW